MTSFVETAVAPTRASDVADRHALREAMAEERRAYEQMRALVPDLALPRERRRPLTERQQAAIEHYQELREQLESLRSARRSPALGVRRDQSA